VSQFRHFFTHRFWPLSKGRTGERKMTRGAITGGQGGFRPLFLKLFEGGRKGDRRQHKWRTWMFQGREAGVPCRKRRFFTLLSMRKRRGNCP